MVEISGDISRILEIAGDCFSLRISLYPVSLHLDLEAKGTRKKHVEAENELWRQKYTSPLFGGLDAAAAWLLGADNAFFVGHRCVR